MFFISFSIFLFVWVFVVFFVIFVLFLRVFFFRLEKAAKAFKQFIARNPKHKLVKSANEKLKQAREMIAQVHFQVSKFYQQRGHEKASSLRLEQITQHYADTSYADLAKQILKMHLSNHLSCLLELLICTFNQLVLRITRNKLFECFSSLFKAKKKNPQKQNKNNKKHNKNPNKKKKNKNNK
jgi:F0F1-type ATP synthase membrane subunit b/b'